VALSLGGRLAKSSRVNNSSIVVRDDENRLTSEPASS
jgi:hypothetical protein